MNASETTNRPSLAGHILAGVIALCEEAEQRGEPLEVDPHRGHLFEYFVTAEGAGYVQDESDPDLTADGLGRHLAERWNLADAARASIAQQEKMSAADLSRMRLMWSAMRMWMEWSYAWERWPDFHDQTSADTTPPQSS